MVIQLPRVIVVLLIYFFLPLSSSLIFPSFAEGAPPITVRLEPIYKNTGTGFFSVFSVVNTGTALASYGFYFYWPNDEFVYAFNSTIEPGGGCADPCNNICEPSLSIDMNSVPLGADPYEGYVVITSDQPFDACVNALNKPIIPSTILMLLSDVGNSNIQDSDGDGLADGIDSCPYDPTSECNQCKVIGEECLSKYQCCSGVCNNDGSGTAVCIELDVCRPSGELCSANNNCCSGICELFPDAELGRCLNPPGCLQPGELCGQGHSNNCCGPDGVTGSSEYCQPDATYDVSRCVAL